MYLSNFTKINNAEAEFFPLNESKQIQGILTDEQPALSSILKEDKHEVKHVTNIINQLMGFT